MNTDTTMEPITVAGQLHEGDVAVIHGRIARILYVEDPRAHVIRFAYIQFDATTLEYTDEIRPASLDRNAPVTFL